MKRAIYALVTLLTAIALFSLPAFADSAKENITVTIDNLPVEMDTAPVIKNRRTMVPFRAPAEALNINVDWNGEERTVTAKDKETTVKLQIANDTAYRNSDPVTLREAPFITGGRTFIPLRFFGEAFGCEVQWLSEENKIEITSPPSPLEVTAFYALGDEKTSSWTNLFGREYPETSAGHTGIVDKLALGWYSLDREGSLLTSSTTGWQRPQGWQDVLKASADYDLKTEMVVHVTDKDDKLIDLLNDEQASEKTVKEIAEEAEKYNGVNIDFEGLGYSRDGEMAPEEVKNIKNNLNEFVRELHKKLKQKNRGLTLSLHPLNSVYRGYDYKTLGRLADNIIIMAYDYETTPPPANLVENAVKLAREKVPPQKLSLGISVPGETPESYITKIGIAKRHQLQGIALWRLGIIPPEIWSNTKETIN